MKRIAHSFERKGAGPATLLLAALFASSIGLAEETAEPNDFSAFRIIAERNIFNPNRSSRTARAQSAESERKPVIESFSLLGTMSYEKGKFAFFGSSDSKYQKVLKPSDTIAGYTVADIGGNHVKLESNGQSVELRVGMQLKRQDEGEWQVGSAAESASFSSRSGRRESGRGSASSDARFTPGSSRGSGSSASPGKTESSSSEDESEILKRLLQKRQEEMSK